MWTNLSHTCENPEASFGGWTWCGKHNRRKYSFWDGEWIHDVTNSLNDDATRHPEGDRPEHWVWFERGQKWKHKYTGVLKSGTKDQNPCPPKKLAWNNMSPRDWTAVINSILLMVHNKHFHENFSKDIVDLQWALQIIGSFSFVKVCTACNNGDCKCKCRYCRNQLDHCSCGNSHNNKRLKVSVCNDTAQIQVPGNLDEPNHWGHLAWKFCQFMDSNH